MQFFYLQNLWKRVFAVCAYRLYHGCFEDD